MSFAQSNQCMDPSDMERWVDFGAVPSPTPTSSTSKLALPRSDSTMTSPTSTILPLDQSEELQTPIRPSHEYSQFKQQTGIPTGSLANLAAMSQQSNGGYMFSNTGLDDSVMFDFGSSSGLDASAGFHVDADVTGSAVLPAFFFPPGDGSSQSDDFIDPSAITSQEEQRPANIRFFPGMHQQAALAKAQAQAEQQRRQQAAHQQQQQQQQKLQHSRQSSRDHPARRSASHQFTDARTEATIARVVNQIRQNSALSSGDSASPPGGVLPHVIRMKKDEEDMDEDERLLASEEGKKLSSKERRQLRNKVSARAFRSRRKEYIGQLEGEVAAKTNECNELRHENQALMEENARSRAFIEKLLRHPAFHPFLDDLSRDPSLSDSLPMPGASSVSSAPARKDSHSYSVPQPEFLEVPQTNIQHVGMTLVPEPQLDLSTLNINNNWAMPNTGFNFQQPRVFSVLELPEGPANPFDTDVMSGKGSQSLTSQLPEADGCKTDVPAIEFPVIEEVKDENSTEPANSTADAFDDDDPDYALYTDSSVLASSPAVPVESVASQLTLIDSGKVSTHFELVVSKESDSQRLAERLQKLCARMEPVFHRIHLMTAHLDT